VSSTNLEWCRFDDGFFLSSYQNRNEVTAIIAKELLKTSQLSYDNHRNGVVVKAAAKYQ